MEARVPTRLTPAQGRRFGLTVGVAFLVLAGLLYFWRHKEALGAVAGGLGALLVIAALVAPTRLGPLERAWMALARVISKITTPIFMGIVFFLVMTPLGSLMRAVGRRTLVHRAKTGGYWVAPASGGRSDIERQF